MLVQMDDHIRQQATTRGYGYWTLGALYERRDLKPGKYSVASQLASSFPYGVYTSLDGLHPNAIGSAVLALAAAQGINARYGTTHVLARSAPGATLADQMVEPEGPALLLERARSLGAQRSNRRLPACAAVVCR